MNELRQVVFIAGASSGIGEALALGYAQRGADVVLVARREERLRNLASRIEKLGAKALVIQGDVTVDGDMERAVEKALAAFGRIDIAIANAGFGLVGDLESLTLEDYRRQFETNLFGLMRVIYAVLPALKKTEGRLALMGSIVSYVSAPGRGPYAMSKYAVRALAESLYFELKPSKVSVTLISPGMVESELRQVDNEGKHHPKANAQRTMLHVPAHIAARSMIRAVQCRRREIIVTYHGKVIVFVSVHMPWLMRLMFRFGVKGRDAVHD